MSSAFAARLDGYIACKRELGYAATHEERSLAPRFDRFCRERFPGKERLDKELATAFTNSSDSAATRRDNASFVRSFARYLNEELGEEAYIVPSGAAPPKPPAKPRHIFTQAELDAFFGAADAMEPSYRARARHLVAPVFFRMMLTCGLRPKEARDLRVSECDLEAGVIHITGSKDNRDRDIPMHEDMRRLCVAYDTEVERVFPGREHFFPGSDGGCWGDVSMRTCFWKCWEDAGMTEFSGPDPVPYSFRHTFATNTIVRWRAEGVDVEANLRFLQVYMGHADIESTLYYCHLVRGGLGDPTSVPTWTPANRIEEEGYFYV